MADLEKPDTPAEVVRDAIQALEQAVVYLRQKQPGGLVDKPVVNYFWAADLVKNALSDVLEMSGQHHLTKGG